MGYVDLKYKYSDETSQIIACALEVHKTLGNGFQAAIYQKALAIEMELNNITFASEEDMEIFYKEKNIGTSRSDFLIDDKMIIEIKAIILLEDEHLEQTLNYLEANNLEMGLLINFGAKSLEFKRVMNKKYKDNIM